MPDKVCGGRWTVPKFHSFIKSLLRSGTRRWGPIQDCKKKSNVRRGFYLCAGHKTQPHEVTATIKDKNGKRVVNIFIDHVCAIIDPTTGFTTWDSVIKRMYCEADNLQTLCKECHDLKTADEREIAKNRKKNNE